jgi:ATP phosphoribosyltransferase regulatory subunit HisZ
MVNVPANADAMLMAYKGLKQADIKDETIKELGIPVEVTEKLVEVIDTLDVVKKDIEELKLVKAPKATDPQEQTKIRQRLSMNKVIARAADKILEADKKGVQIDQKNLVKVIKRANELITVGEKSKLDGTN